jgi:hypothetical protein
LKNLKNFTQEQKTALAALAEIRKGAKKSKITPKMTMSAALREQKKICRERNSSH